MKNKENNFAFIDGQNLYMNMAKKEVDSWKVDLARFRVYLEKKYNVNKAYYFLGYVQETNQELYEEIQNAGFVLIFREHSPAMIGKKRRKRKSCSWIICEKNLSINEKAPPRDETQRGTFSYECLIIAK